MAAFFSKNVHIPVQYYHMPGKNKKINLQTFINLTLTDETPAPVSPWNFVMFFF